MKFCDCENCLHRECCCGPQDGCEPAYTPDHYTGREYFGEDE